jgi:hypothetical protein
VSMTNVMYSQFLRHLFSRIELALIQAMARMYSVLISALANLTSRMPSKNVSVVLSEGALV